MTQEGEVNRAHTKARIDEIFDRLTQRDLDGLDKMLDPHYIDHTAWGDIEGLAAFKELMQNCWLNPFHDARFEVSNVIVDGHWGAWQVHFTGTNNVGVAPVCLQSLSSCADAITRWSLMGLPPTGKSVDVLSLHMVVLDEDNRLVEHWTGNDQLVMMRQLGLLPDPALASGV
jgi:predicted ester cyclase